MILSAVLAMTLVAAPSADQPLMTAKVVVEERGPIPPFGSGFLHVTFWVSAREADGTLSRYYVTYMGEGQPLPPVGAECTFRYQVRPLEVVAGMDTNSSRDSGPTVSSYDCGDMHFST